MSAKKRSLSDLGGIMYSTDPEFKYEAAADTPKPEISNQQQDLRVMLDKKNRAGKAVTLVTGFLGSDEALDKLAKLLKTRCGVGGATKEGVILIQGDFRDKVLGILQKEGFKVKKSGG